MTTKVKDIGTPLINTQHEAFAQFIFQGYNNTQAAKLAKYKEKSAYAMGSRLLKKVEIVDRISQLSNAMAKSNIGTREERETILTEIYKNKREDPRVKISSIDTHNKMDRLYTPDITQVTQRSEGPLTLVFVLPDGTKLSPKLTQPYIEGEIVD